jgi:hypothetical protein
MADLRYPLRPGTGDYILFSIFEYQGGGVTIGDNFGLQTARKGGAQGTIALPIQSTISDQNAVDWKEDRLDAIRASAGLAGMEFTQEGTMSKTLSKVKEAAAKGKDEIGKAVSTSLLEGALGVNLLSRFSGQVMNPNLELLFNGPTLRTFNFTFFMSARSPEEAARIKQIINTFKKNMAVKTANSLFLKSPNIFEIKYMNGNGSQHQSLNQIKVSALQSMNVDYTPAGTYSTFDDTDNTMTAYRMTLQFGELDPIYDRDYADGHPIGF